MLIIPNSTTTDERFFEKSLTLFAHRFRRIHIDIQDGQFVPNTTLSFAQMLPYLQQHPDIVFDFHIQTTDAARRSADILNHTQLRIGAIYLPRADQEYESTDPRSYLIMTIDAGPQGQPFKPERLEKIHKLRTSGYSDEVLLDGGINDKTAPSIMALPKSDRPDGICIGSYFSNAVDSGELTSCIQKLQSQISTVQ